MKNDGFVYVTFIKTTPEKLWEALTNTEFMHKYWFGSSFETDWAVGSTIQEFHDNGKPGFDGEIRVFDPPKHLAYSFRVAGEPDTEVSFSIESAGPTVRLTVTHTGYEKDSKFYKSTSLGWSAILCGVKSLLETGETMDQDSIYKLFDRAMAADS